jgi:hypothetical protein
MVLRCLNVLLVLTFVTACSSLRPTPTTAAQKAAEEKPVPVIIDHDGGVEDLVAVMLLMLEPRVNLLMVSYVEAGECRCGPQLLQFPKGGLLPTAWSTTVVAGCLFGCKCKCRNDS